MSKITISVGLKDFDITLDEEFAKFFEKDFRTTFGEKTNIDTKELLYAYVQKCYDEYMDKEEIKNLLQNSYIKIPTSSIKSKNIASVMVTATLPPFSRQGDKINLNISSLGDAKSIDNGQLLLIQLKGLNGEVYAIVQRIVVANNDNLTTGYIYEDAIIENEIDFSLKDEVKITLSLIKQSVKNATLVEKKINEKSDLKIAQALDTRTIEVKKLEACLW